MPRPFITVSLTASIAAVFAGPAFGQTLSAPSAATRAAAQPAKIPAATAVAASSRLAPVPARDRPNAWREGVSPNAVREANSAAKIQPTRAGYLGAMQVYPFSDGALYQLYTAPGEITDIALQPGEALAGTGPVAAGDTVRWIIGDTESGAGVDKRIHILVKPTAASLASNLVINTDRRTYHVELRSTPATYMASVSWTYPQDELIAISARAAEAGAIVAAQAAAAPVASGIDVEALNFRYRITGDKPSWRPVRVFDDGRQTFIQFAEGIAQGDMPPLWVTGPTGAELVNYRVRGSHIIVDRLFSAAELRLGAKHQKIVRIVREDGRARS